MADTISAEVWLFNDKLLEEVLAPLPVDAQNYLRRFMHSDAAAKLRFGSVNKTPPKHDPAIALRAGAKLGG